MNIKVIILDPLDFTPTLTPANCHGDQGSVQVSQQSGGTGSISFFYTDSTGYTDQADFPLAIFAGNYSLEMVDANGCSASKPIQVTQPGTI